MYANRYKLTEHDEQKRVIAWAEQMSLKWPALKLLYAVPNMGKRTIGAAKYLIAEGMRKGVPDLVLPVPKNGYGALYIEMKRKGGRVAPEQEAWRLALNKAGNLAVVCWSADEAIKVLTEYLNG